MTVIATVLAFGAGTARAENLDAGKPAPALFAATCSACHASPKGLARSTSGRGLVDFLRQHYTASPESAGALASYLMANPGDPRAKQAPAGGRAAASPPDGTPAARPAAKTERPPHQTATARPDSMVEPTDGRRAPEARPDESAKGAGRNKRQQAKQQETPAPPPAQAAEPPAAGAAPAAPVAAPEPAPDQPAFSAPSP
jgi:hypothetical protein